MKNHLIFNSVVRESIKSIFLKDIYLLQNNLNERTITHKMAEYIQNLLSGYNVDCEYNRMINENGENVSKSIDVNELLDAMNKYKKSKEIKIIKEKKSY